MWGLDQSSGAYKKTNSNFLSWLWYTMMYFFGEQMSNISVAEIVLNELKHLHHQMKREKQLFFMTLRADPMKNKRLLYLFQKDLLPGIHGMILEAKASRDEVILKGSSKQAKLLGWMYLGVMNVGMLFYILLFALTQTTERQQAWGQSFALWLVAEIFIVGTLLVLIMHVWIPAITMTDVLSIQKKLSETISNYQKNLADEKVKQEKARERKYLLVADDNNNEEKAHEGDLSQVLRDDEKRERQQRKKSVSVKQRKSLSEQRRKSTLGKLMNQKSAVQRSEVENSLVVLDQMEGAEEKKEVTEGVKWKPFNATKYLFLSNRISNLYSDLTIAKIILNFHSPYPKQSYQYVANLSSSYEQSTSGISRAFSILLLYFLTSLLAMPVSMQDMFIQATTTVMSGYVILVHYQLFHLSPMLVVVPVATIGTLLSVIQIMKKHSKGEQERLKKLKLAMMEKDSAKKGIITNTTTKVPQERKARRLSSVSLSSSRRASGRHVTRRASMAQGIQTAQEALRSVAKMAAHSEGPDTNANNSDSDEFSSWFDDEEFNDNSTLNEDDEFDRISFSDDDDIELDDEDEMISQNLHQPKTTGKNISSC
jgi:hypothetical protein